MVDEYVSVAGVGGWCSASLERSPCLLSPGMVTRAAARLRRLELDRRLARGIDPSGSALLAARAAQLACPVSRRRIAGALERFAVSPNAPRGPFRSLPLPGAVGPNRDALLELAGALRRSGVLYARGIASLELILIDGCGPAYTDPRGEGLARQLQIAADGLAG